MPDSDITVSGLAVTPGFGQNFLSWSFTDPNESGLDRLKLSAVEIWAATSNDRSLAAKVVEGLTDKVHVVSDGAARYYWAKARNRSGDYGDWQPSGATSGVAAGATASSGVNGYVKLPSGVIIQWGFVGTTPLPVDVTFPIPFPNRCFGVTSTHQGIPGTDSAFVIQVGLPSLTGFQISARVIDNTGAAVSEAPSISAPWIAIGN